MTTARIGSYADFWPGFVRDHQTPLLRKLHFVGTTFALTGFAAGLLTRRYSLIPLSLAAAYGAARLSHQLVDGKAPGMQGYFLWSVRAEFMMWLHMLRGTMADELAQHASDEGL